MENYINNLPKNTSKFTVTISDVNNSRILLPITLYNKMSKFASNSITNTHYNITDEPEIVKLNILKNAYLNDQLEIRSKILKFDGQNVELSVEVFKNFDNEIDIICNAIFTIKLESQGLITAL